MFQDRFLSPSQGNRFLSPSGSQDVDPERSQGLLSGAFQAATAISLGAARAAALVPAGIEKFVGSGIEALTDRDIRGPFEAFVDRTLEAEAALEELTGFETTSAAPLVGELGVAIGTGAFTLKGLQALATRIGPRAIRPILSVGSAAEGAAFVGGDPRSDSPGFIGLGAALGAGGGLLVARQVKRAVQALALREGGEAAASVAGPALRRAAPFAPDRPNVAALHEALRSGRFASESGEAVGRAVSNARMIAHIPDNIAGRTVATNDAAVAGLRVLLSESGRGGAAGVVKFVGRAPDNLVQNLGSEFADYTFRLTREGDALVYSKAGEITDEVLETVSRTGVMPGQKGLFAGSEVRVTEALPEGKIRVEDLARGTKYTVNAEDVAGLDAALGFGSVPDNAIELWRGMRRRFPDESQEQTFRRLVTDLSEDLDSAAIPDLRRAILRSERAREVATLPQAEQSLLSRFESAVDGIRRKVADGEIKLSLDEEAAARGYAISGRSGGRFVATALPPRPDAGLSVGPFRNAGEARAFLRAQQVTPETLMEIGVGSVPDEFLAGAFRSFPRRGTLEGFENAVEEGAIKTKGPIAALKQFWSKTADEFVAPVRGKLLRAAERLERREIFTDGFDAVNSANNLKRTRVAQVSERVAKSGLTKLSPERRAIVDAWLSSNAPSIFAKSQGMTAQELAVARNVRSIFNDMFEDFAASANTTLSFDDFWRFYSPSMSDEIQRSGATTLQEFYTSRGVSIPKEAKFFGEMFNTGELALEPQADLIQKLMRVAHSGYFKSIVGPAFENAANLATTVDDPTVRRTMIEFLAWTRGSGSASREGVRAAMSQFIDELGVSIPDLAKRNISDFFFQGFYGAALGFRGGPVLRQFMQNHWLLAPLIPGGHRRILQVQARLADPKLFTVKGLAGEADHAWAVEAGIIPKRTPVPLAESVERGIAETPSKALRYWDTLNRKSLQVFGNFDEYNRTVAAVAYRDLLRDEVPRLVANEVTGREFAERVSMNIMGEPIVNEFMTLLQREGQEEAIRFASRNFAEFGNFIYGSQNAPARTRSGFGRVAGQLQTWPVGYLDWLRTTMANSTKAQKVRIAASHGLAGIAIANTGAAVGYNLGGFIAWNTLGYTGGPYLDVLKNAHTVFSGGPGRERALAELQSDLPRFVFPGAFFVKDVALGIQALNEGNPEAGFLSTFLGIRETESGALRQATPFNVGQFLPENGNGKGLGAEAAF